MTQEERISALERSVRRYQRLFLAGVAIISLGATAKQTATPDVVAAREFRLLDSSGRSRAIIQMAPPVVAEIGEPGYSPVVALLDQEGSRRVELMFDSFTKASRLHFFDDKQNSRVALVALKDSSGLVLTADKHDASIQVSRDNEPFVRLSGAESRFLK